MHLWLQSPRIGFEFEFERTSSEIRRGKPAGQPELIPNNGNQLNTQHILFQCPRCLSSFSKPIRSREHGSGG
jgi:hypothetical protein